MDTVMIIQPGHPQNTMNFTNLHEGDYTFMVKARNVYGRESEPAYIFIYH